MSRTEKAADLSVFDIDVGEIARLGTQFDVFRFMKRLTEYYGFKSFMVLNLPAVTSLELSASTIITNWPAELITQFDREGLMQASIVLQRLRRSTLPFSYDLDKIAHEPKGQKVRDMFAPYGAARWTCLPVHDASGSRGAMVLGGMEPEPGKQQMMELLYAAVHVFERLMEIRNMDVREKELLTEREIDCLNWTAAGKTSAEIADILGLSEHTVNHYLNRAARKLDTVNRTQAVAKALRTGLIK